MEYLSTWGGGYTTSVEYLSRGEGTPPQWNIDVDRGGGGTTSVEYFSRPPIFPNAPFFHPFFSLAGGCCLVLHGLPFFLTFNFHDGFFSGGWLSWGGGVPDFSLSLFERKDGRKGRVPHFYQTFAEIRSILCPGHEMPNQTSDFGLYTHSCGGPPAGSGALGLVAGPHGRGLNSPHPQGGPGGAPEHPCAHALVHGLQVVGGCALGGCHCAAGVLGPPGSFWLPPSQKRRGWGGGYAGPFGALSAAWMGSHWDEYRLTKRFDLIPQAVALALPLELGMDPGMCRALGAMHKQLCRAFKIARALGSWWQATNGILQGCPLSVIPLNVLTTIWNGEVDSLRRHVCARTAALPPVLDDYTAADLEVGAPFPPQGCGPRQCRAEVARLYG